jgi:hypothetical protein
MVVVKPPPQQSQLQSSHLEDSVSTMTTDTRQQFRWFLSYRFVVWRPTFWLNMLLWGWWPRRSSASASPGNNSDASPRCIYSVVYSVHMMNGNMVGKYFDSWKLEIN